MAVEDFMEDRAHEPALDVVNKRVLMGFLTNLRDNLK